MKDLYYTDFSGLALLGAVDDRGRPWDDRGWLQLFVAVCRLSKASQLLIPSRDEDSLGETNGTGAAAGHTMGTPWAHHGHTTKKSCMIEEKCGEIDEFVVGQPSCNHNMKYVEFWFLVWSLLLSAEIHMPRLLGLRKLSLCVGNALCILSLSFTAIGSAARRVLGELPVRWQLHHHWLQSCDADRPEQVCIRTVAASRLSQSQQTYHQQIYR